VTYSKSRQNKKEVNNRSHLYRSTASPTHRIRKNSLMLVNIHFAKRKCLNFQLPPTARRLLVGFTITDTPYLVGLLRTSDQPDAEASTWHHTTLTKDRYTYPQRDSHPKSQQARGHRHTPHTARPLGSVEMRQNANSTNSEEFK